MNGLVNTLATAIPKAHAPGANLPAVITLTAAASVWHVVDRVTGGYTDVPTGGSLTIAATVQGTAVSQVIPITNGGGFVLHFDPPIQGDQNTEIVITLAAGGAGISGKVNAMTR